MTNRTKYCVANFKMNKTVVETNNYISRLIKSLNLDKETYVSDIVICPPFTSLNIDSLIFETLSFYNISIGSQNINSKESGAYTGEISAEMIRDVGAKYVILGHSERREYFKESDEEINKKLNTALSYNLIPILCLGENLEQRKNDQIEEILKNQLSKCLKNINSNLIIAYEPIWAIGTGETATSEIIVEAHQMIRKILNDIGFDGQKVSILYGGSVNRNNAKELIALDDVDGFLIGGASLDVNHFYDIYKFIEESY